MHMSTARWFNDYCSQKLSPNQHPSHVEILAPPAVLCALVAIALTTLVLSNKWRIRQFQKKHKLNSKIANTDPRDPGETPSTGVLTVDELIGDHKFYSDFDLEVLKCLSSHLNRPLELLKICVPCFLSLLLTSGFIFLDDVIIGCLWPGSHGRPDINVAISCFLAPAGLVYALSFGFTLQFTMNKNRSVLNKITGELSDMDQMATLVTKLNLPSPRHDMAMYKAIKSEAIFMALLIINKRPRDIKAKPPTDIKVHLWSVLDVLRDAVTHPEYNFNMNLILVDKVVTHLLKLNSICSDRMGILHTNIHPLKWMFLEVLGGMTLFGVLLIDSESRTMEIALCELTVFSVAMMCFVLADLDSPFHGFLRLDISVLPDVVKRVESLYEKAKVEAKAGQEHSVEANMAG